MDAVPELLLLLLLLQRHAQQVLRPAMLFGY